MSFKDTGFRGLCAAGWLACAMGLTGPALAGVVSLDGTGSVTTKTVENYHFTLHQTAATETVETYATRVLGYLNGQALPVVEFNLLVSSSAQAVQDAFVAALAALTSAAGANLSFAGPTLTQDERSLLSSTTQGHDAPIDMAGLGVLVNVDTQELVGEADFTFESGHCTGVAVSYGGCIASGQETVHVNAGNTVLLTSGQFEYEIQRTMTTTNTYLSAQTWVITGTSVSGVPVAPTWLLAMPLLLFVSGSRRRSNGS